MEINKKILLPVALATIALIAFTSSTFFQGSLIFNSGIPNADEISSNIQVKEETMLLASGYANNNTVSLGESGQETYRFFTKAFKDDIRLNSISLEVEDTDLLLSNHSLYINDIKIDDAKNDSEGNLIFEFDTFNNPIIPENEIVDFSIRSNIKPIITNSNFLIRLSSFDAMSIDSESRLNKNEVQIENAETKVRYLHSVPELKTKEFSLSLEDGENEIYNFEISSQRKVHIARLSLNVEAKLAKGTITDYSILDSKGNIVASNPGTGDGGVFVFDFKDPLEVEGNNFFRVYANIENLDKEADSVGVQLMTDFRNFSTNTDLGLFDARKDQAASFIWTNEPEKNLWKNGSTISTLPTIPQLSN